MKKLRKRVGSTLSTSTIQLAITALPLMTMVLFTIVNLFSRGSVLHSIFVPDNADTFMDYFNMLYNVKRGDPYYANANYPAINFLFLKVLLHFSPLEARPTTGVPRQQAWDMRGSMPMLLPFIVFELICLLIIAFCVRKMTEERSRTQQNLLVASVLLNAPMLFLVERGNLLVLALALLFTFIAYGDSANTCARYLGCTALALSAAMKLYPAVFALLLLRRSQYKEFVFTAALGTVFLIAPFFVFDGLDSIAKMLTGILISSDTDWGLGINYSLANLARIVMAFFGMVTEPGGIIPTLVSIAVCLVLFLLSKEEWQAILSLSIMCIWTPGFSYTYALTFLLPAWILMLESAGDLGAGIKGGASACPKHILLLTTICLCFLPLPIVSPVESLYPDAKFVLYWGCLIINVSLVVMYGTTLWSAIRMRFGRRAV